MFTKHHFPLHIHILISIEPTPKSHKWLLFFFSTWALLTVFVLNFIIPINFTLPLFNLFAYDRKSYRNIGFHSPYCARVASATLAIEAHNGISEIGTILAAKSPHDNSCTFSPLGYCWCFCCCYYYYYVQYDDNHIFCLASLVPYGKWNPHTHTHTYKHLIKLFCDSMKINKIFTTNFMWQQ